jgi:hypothetical protein
MKHALLILSFVSFGCGGSDGSSTDGSPATGDGPAPTADGSVSPGADGSVSMDVASNPGTDGGTAADMAPASSDGAVTNIGPIPAMGDHYCQAGPQPSEDYQFALGYDATCLITQAPMSPLTAMQKMGYDYACTFYGGAKVVADCPRDNVVAYCTGLGLQPLIGGMLPPVTKGWKLIYKSAVLPDTNAVALNGFGLCPGGTLYDASNAPIPVRTCKGTFTTKVNGVDKSFTEKRTCTVKSVGMKAEFAIVGDTTTNDRLSLLVARDAMGAYKIGNFVYPSAAYLEGGTKPFAVATMQTVTVTKLDEKAGTLTATFNIGEIKSGNDSRMITDGVLDLQLTP